MRNWVIGIGVIVLVLGGLFLMGYIPAGEGIDSDIGVVWYDADGNEINLPLAFMRNNTEVTDMGVRIGWSYTGIGFVSDTLVASGHVRINLLDQTTHEIIKELAQEPWSSTSGARYIQWLVSLQMILPMEYSEGGWLIQATTTLSATIEDEQGTIHTDTTEDLFSDIFLIEWLDLEFSISGYIVA